MPDMKHTIEVTDDVIAAATEALEAEVKRRNEWYGLDNWYFEEVVRFVLDRAEGWQAAQREGEDA